MTKMFYDALGSPVPQTLNEDGTFSVLANGEVTDVDFSKLKLLRDLYGNPLPYQYYDVNQGEFVPGMIGGSGGGSDIHLEHRISTLENYFNTHFYPVTPVKPVRIIDFETFESDERYGVIQGEYPWGIDKTSLPYSLKSSNQGQHNTVSSITIVFEITDLTGMIELEFFCSSEGSRDRMYVQINGSEWFTSGDISSWNKASAELIRGTHTLVINYQKDGSVDTNLDTAFIRNVKITG